MMKATGKVVGGHTPQYYDNLEKQGVQTFSNVYFAPHNKEDLIRRILYDIAQADFPGKKKDFGKIVDSLQKIRGK